MKAVRVILECLTNMHVGNGDVNYNIIDNEVERDPITNYPTINASGIKGSLRQYFSEQSELSDKIDAIFGSNAKGNTSAGLLKFLGADMIALPVRASKGDQPYYLVSTEVALDKYEKNCRIFSLKSEIGQKSSQIKEIREAEGIVLENAVTFFDKKIYIMEKEKFGQLALPVVARNKLENGISKNLWYEEIVPHESIFSFFVLAYEKDQGLLMEFKRAVDGQVIQFGGNASIGYGFCNVKVTGE